MAMPSMAMAIVSAMAVVVGNGNGVEGGNEEAVAVLAARRR